MLMGEEPVGSFRGEKMQMNKIGVMQGRLTDKGGFFPQIFPFQNWKQEFVVASKIGFDSIEWMFNDEDWSNNPIMLDSGIDELNRLMNETGVSVSSICANYFMKHCIYSSNSDEVASTEKILDKLISNAEKIQCANIIIPMFEESELLHMNSMTVNVIGHFLNKIEQSHIRILIETDMEAKALKAHIHRYASDFVGVCFDLGNIAGIGRNLQKEIDELGSLIKNVHIKDKKVSGTTVMLGEGDVNFVQCLSHLSSAGYDGNYILESFYGKEAVNDTIRNYEFLKGVLA